MKYSFPFLLFVGIFTACGDDDVTDAQRCSAQFNVEFQNELDAINLATNEYAMDQSTANCESLIGAYNDYIDELEDWEECATINNQVEDWRASIDSARQSINSIQC